jgi:hypothetical protein
MFFGFFKMKKESKSMFWIPTVPYLNRHFFHRSYCWFWLDNLNRPNTSPKHFVIGLGGF